MGNIAVHTQNLGKSYDGTVYALHDLSLEIPSGAVFGFLGPNGAGKTTTVKLMAGLIKPTTGSCAIFDCLSEKNPLEVHRLCGVVTKTAKLYGRLTGMENMLFFGQTFGLKKRECRQRAEELLKRLDLWDMREKRTAEYPTGKIQRLSLARAMLSKPRLLLLDEPTDGLDPESAQCVDSLLKDLIQREAITIFLCTHQLSYAQSLCSSFGIIDKGKMVACGDLESLSMEIGTPLRARFRMRGGQISNEFRRLNGDIWEKDLENEEEMPVLLRNLISSGADVFAAQVIRPSLEDLYPRFVELKEDAK